MPTVLITGAASGIGRAAARRFAADGWRGVFVDRDGEALAALGRELPGRHALRTVDLTDPRSIAALADVAGPLDAVINNAGRSDPGGLGLVDQPAERQAGLAALNLAAPAAVVRAVAGQLAAGARIVNVASGAGLRAIPWRGWYSATKAGLIAQSRALAAARPDLAVIVLCPGFVRTELVDGLIAAGRLDPGQAVAKTPLGRMAEPDELADAMRFLASPAAAVIRGEVVSLCGGSSVYGGSRPSTPSTAPPRPRDAPLELTVAGDPDGAWRALAGPAGRGGPAAAVAPYPGTIDAGPLAAPPGGLTVAVHEAARRFAAAQARDASLTLLLPAEAGADPSAAGPSSGAGRAGDAQAGDTRAIDERAIDAAIDAAVARAGDAAAARMLVATLACELAPRALRVNAVAVSPGVDRAALRALLHHVAGARSQYLTGQTLRTMP